MPNPPLHRHPALQPFSRDHYEGLVTARHLVKQARLEDLRRFVSNWRKVIAEHFDDEERLLIDLIADAADVQRLRAEHAQLRQLAAEAQRRLASRDAAEQWLREVGQTLNDHIRWEERHLFERIQRDATEAQLAALAERTERIEQSRPRDACAPPHEQ